MQSLRNFDDFWTTIKTFENSLRHVHDVLMLSKFNLKVCYVFL